MSETRRQRVHTKKKQQRPQFSAATADKHDLYQRSVQDPEIEIAFLQRVYRKTFGRTPLSLREDFCGTALFCALFLFTLFDYHSARDLVPYFHVAYALVPTSFVISAPPLAVRVQISSSLA